MAKAKFAFNEIVKISSNKLELTKVNGKIGIVRGFSQSEIDSAIFAYAIDILDKNGKITDGWFIYEEDLHSTGKKADPKEFETGESIRVKVDPETGEGSIVDEE